VTRRAWTIAAIGLAAAVALGGFSVAKARSTTTFTPSASWSLFSPEQWSAVKATLAGRGFDSSTVRVLSGTQTSRRKPFALVEAQRGAGRACVSVVRGAVVGSTVCRLRAPMLSFALRDRCRPCAPAGSAPARVVLVLGLARRDVASLASTDASGRETGGTLIPAPFGWEFQSGAAVQTDLIARDAAGHLLARVALPRR
jgi:hypothetical protein